MRRFGMIAITASLFGSIACQARASSAFPLQLAMSAEGPARTIAREGLNVAALDRVVVWEGRRGTRAVLMRAAWVAARARISGVRPGTWFGSRGSPGSFQSLDLGLDRRGRVVAVYERCGARGCSGPFRVNVRSGDETRLRPPVPSGCRRPYPRRLCGRFGWRMPSGVPEGGAVASM